MTSQFSGESKIYPRWESTDPWGAPTSNTRAFLWKRMQKQKNWVPLGKGEGPVPAVPPGSANAIIMQLRRLVTTQSFSDNTFLRKPPFN